MEWECEHAQRVYECVTSPDPHPYAALHVADDFSLLALGTCRALRGLVAVPHAARVASSRDPPRDPPRPLYHRGASPTHSVGTVRPPGLHPPTRREQRPSSALGTSFRNVCGVGDVYAMSYAVPPGQKCKKATPPPPLSLRGINNLPPRPLPPAESLDEFLAKIGWE